MKTEREYGLEVKVEAESEELVPLIKEYEGEYV